MKPNVPEKIYINSYDWHTKDLCKVCKHYWVDFIIHPDKTCISHCEIVDEKYNFKCLDDIVEYPCLECPFNSFIRKD